MLDSITAYLRTTCIVKTCRAMWLVWTLPAESSTMGIECMEKMRIANKFTNLEKQLDAAMNNTSKGNTTQVVDEM